MSKEALGKADENRADRSEECLVQAKIKFGRTGK